MRIRLPNNSGELDPIPAEDEATLTGLLTSIAWGCVEALRKNKIASVLAATALLATTFLAASSRYDERPRYRQVLLPEIAESESRFLLDIRAAEDTGNEGWRIYYFVNANRKARDTLALLKRRWPQTRDGIRAHGELVQYYELINEDFAIIRTQLSLHDNLDYLGEWKKVQADRWPVHEQWAAWVRGTTPLVR